MKAIKPIFILFLTLFIVTSYSSVLANNYGDDKSSAKSIEKQREKKIKEDEKFLARAKKEFWKAQSKQVKKTIKKTNKRINDNYGENYLLY